MLATDQDRQQGAASAGTAAPKPAHGTEDSSGAPTAARENVQTWQSELTRDIIDATYSPDLRKLTALVSGDRFQRLFSAHLGFEVGNFYVFDESRGELLFLHKAVADGVEMPFYRVTGKDSHGSFISEKVTKEDYDKRRAAQEAASSSQGEQTTAMLCYQNLTDGRPRRSQGEEKNGWLLISEGEIVVFAFEYFLRQALEHARVESRDAALEWLSEHRVATIWGMMHDPAIFPNMANRKQTSFQHAVEWLQIVLGNRQEFAYLWDAPEDRQSWFIRGREEVLGVLGADTMLSNPAVTSLAGMMIRYSPEPAVVNGEWLTGFFSRSRVSPRLELLHGTHNVVVFLLLVYLTQESREQVEPIRAFLVGTFFDRDTCERTKDTIKALCSLIATRDVFRFTVVTIDSLLRRQKELEQDKFRRITVFAGHLAHKIKDLMIPIGEDIEKSDAIARRLRLRAIRRPAESALELYNELNALVAELLDGIRDLSPSKNVEPILVTVDLYALLGKLIDGHSFAAEGDNVKVRLRSDLDPGESVATTDPRLLRYSVLNLIRNAVEASNANGIVEVRIGRRDADNLFVSVRDWGCGIEEANRERIFHPWETTKEKGLGLGLSIVRRYVDALGGRLSLDTDVGQGSTFTIELLHSRVEGGD